MSSDTPDPSTAKSDIKMVPTRILIISDTHNFQFRNPKLPLSLPLPEGIDVLLHCGDLTNTGGLSEYRNALRMLAQIPAKLKLVIAGNHDRTLDRDWVLRSVWGETKEAVVEDLEECREAVAIMKGELAREVGVHYLEEGVTEWVLDNGASLRVYASPYTREFCGWGFAYERKEDRFNPEEARAEGIKGVKGAVPIPSWEAEKGVDIVMTHGPPLGILDKVEGRSGNVGCESLVRALGRARPKLFCCGHIHEGHGAEVAEWTEDEAEFGLQRRKGKRTVESQWPEVTVANVDWGKETLMVNASIMNVRYDPFNKPWLIELDLPRNTK